MLWGRGIGGHFNWFNGQLIQNLETQLVGRQMGNLACKNIAPACCPRRLSLLENLSGSGLTGR